MLVLKKLQNFYWQECLSHLRRTLFQSKSDRKTWNLSSSPGLRSRFAESLSGVSNKISCFFEKKKRGEEVSGELGLNELAVDGLHGGGGGGGGGVTQ